MAGNRGDDSHQVNFRIVNKFFRAGISLNKWVGRSSYQPALRTQVTNGSEPGLRAGIKVSGYIRPPVTETDNADINHASAPFFPGQVLG